MRMTRKELALKKDMTIEALSLYESFFNHAGHHPMSKFDGGNDFQHVSWMCVQAKGYAESGRTDKALKWLGFIQGCLFCWKVYSIEELKQHNMENISSFEQEQTQP